MIKSIVINNYQSHKKTIIKLVEGVNVIVGKSQAGKTAILRALNWVLTNRPSGSRFVRHGESNTSVTVRTFEGNKVTLKLTPKGRSYFVNGTPYRKFGKAIPESVGEVLRMSSINIQSQLESPFLVTSSGTEIAKAINRITKAEKVDRWLASITSEINTIRRDGDAVENELSEIKTELDGLAHINKLAKKVGEAKGVLFKRRKIIRKWNDLRKLYIQYQKYSEQLEPLQIIDDLLPEVEAASTKLRDAEELREDAAVASRFITLSRDLEQLTGIISHLDQQTAEIDRLNGQIDDNSTTINDLESWIESLEAEEYFDNQIAPLRTRYIRMIKEDETCPICFGDIDDEAIERIEEML